MTDRLDMLLSLSSDAFRAEEEGIERHSGTAEKYIAAIGAILTVQVMESKALTFAGGQLSVLVTAFTLIGIAVLVVALACTVWSMHIRKYPDFPKTAQLMKLRNGAAVDQEVKTQIVMIYLDMRDGILAVNERRARSLAVAGRLLLVGFAIDVVGQFCLKLLQGR